MKTHYNIQVLICEEWESLATDGSFRRFRLGTSQFLYPKAFGSLRAAVKVAEALDSFPAVRVMEYTAPPDGSRTWGKKKVWETEKAAA
jgi:hypothetical protein